MPRWKRRSTKGRRASKSQSLSLVLLPDGKFTEHIGQLNLNMSFTQNLSWNLVGQYDNVSNEFGLNSRIRRAVQPSSDIFLVFNHNADTEQGWHSNVSEVSAKLAWTIRY